MINQNLSDVDVDLKIYRYLRLHIKIICRRFRNIAFLFFEMCAGAIYEIFV